MTLTGNLHKLIWTLAQRSRSSVIIITSWRLHVQVFVVGESTGDESTQCIVIQRNCRKSWDTTNYCLKTSVHKAFKEITVWLVFNIEFNETWWHCKHGHDFSQWQEMNWQSVHFLKHSNFRGQGRHQILVIRRLTTCVIIRQFREKMRRLRLNQHNVDTKTTWWMCRTSRRVKSTMSGICNHITNLAQECRHMWKEIM